MNRLIDISQILPSIWIPTLVLHSQADAVAPISEGRRLAAAIPHARLIEYNDIPHAGFSADSQPLVNDIEEFVTGHRSDEAGDIDRVLATYSPTLWTPPLGRLKLETGAGASYSIHTTV